MHLKNVLALVDFQSLFITFQTCSKFQLSPVKFNLNLQSKSSNQFVFDLTIPVAKTSISVVLNAAEAK
jgi:hypothetical protein